MNTRSIEKQMRRQAFYPWFGLRLAWRVRVPMSLYPIALPLGPNFNAQEESFAGHWTVRESENGSETISIGQVHGHKDHVPADARFVEKGTYADTDVIWWEATRTIWPGKIGDDRDMATTENLPDSDIIAYREREEWLQNYLYGAAYNQEGINPALATLLDAFSSWPKNVYLLESTDEYMDVVVSCKPNYMPYFARDMARAYRVARRHNINLQTLKYGYKVKSRRVLRIEKDRYDWRKDPKAKAQVLAMRRWQKKKG